MKADFIARVMQIMNELGWDDSGLDAFIGSDKTKVTEHIESVFVDSWRKAVNIFPSTYFEVRDFSSSGHVWDLDTGLGYVLLPGDFYALCSFKMVRWQKAVETLLDGSDFLASVQANEYTRGNEVRPVCVRGTKRLGSAIVPVLEYYSLLRGEEHKIEEALYIPLIAPLGETTTLNEKLFTPLAYLCASQVFSIFEKPEVAKVLEAKAIEMIR